MARKMKNSGIEWIGVIPEDWKLGRVKHGFIRKKQEAHQDNPVILSLARAGVHVRDISNNEGQIAESYYNYNVVSPGDLLLNPMDLYSGANCSISKVGGVISPAYVNLGAKEGFHSAYYDYFFKTQYWAMVLFAHGKGVSFDNRWTLSNEDLMNYRIPNDSFAPYIHLENGNNYRFYKRTTNSNMTIDDKHVSYKGETYTLSRLASVKLFEQTNIGNLLMTFRFCIQGCGSNMPVATRGFACFFLLRRSSVRIQIVYLVICSINLYPS